MSLMGDMIAKWNSVLNVDGLVEDKIQDFPHTVTQATGLREKMQEVQSQWKGSRATGGLPGCDP